MREEITKAVVGTVKELFKLDVQPVLTRPAEQFGDYATNVALQLAAKIGQKPREVADQLAEKLQTTLKEQVSEVTVAGPGFINFRLTDETLAQNVATIDKNYGHNDLYKDKTVVSEYSDPNPFKVLHAGHLYTSVVGDSIATLFEAAGAKVHRVNFGGDVGLHVAKTMWAILKELGGEKPDKLKDIPPAERAEWMTRAYVSGNNAYEDDEQAKRDITNLNKELYQVHADNDHKSPLAQIYWTTRTWSYDYFEDFYKRLGSSFEKYYPESEVAELGLQTVKEQLKKGVFEESDGAIVFPGDKHNLHTRVFINSAGLPTYEAKDIGLILHKWQDYKFDLSVVITANEIDQYMQVVLKALEQFAPELAQKTVHLTHGIVKLKGGVKMSSRKGNILRATDVLDAAAKANHELSGKEQPAVVVGAVKYAFLKQGMGGDIVYDPEESVAIQGNSGPYLQYAHARARSILSKAGKSKVVAEAGLEPAERSLGRKLTEFPEVIENAVLELAPHHVATYLYELAQTFNHFYEYNRVIGDKREAVRLQLVTAYAQVLENGLRLLNIEAPARM
jgi:arginyl-tRNA synthetase